MAISQKLKDFLDSSKVPYRILPHSPAYTAPKIAASAHIKGRKVVKCVMVHGDGKDFLLATTANAKVDLDKVEKALGLSGARLEREEDFKGRFPDCDVGAMPPFGNIYGISVVVDEAIYGDDEIVFNGGDHVTLVQMSFDDFRRLANPIRAAVCQN